MLHIINHFPVHQESLVSGDTVIFTENAVFAIKRGDVEPSLFKKTYGHINLAVRKADLILRNIQSCELLKGVVVLDDIDYQSVLQQESVVRSWN